MSSYQSEIANLTGKDTEIDAVLNEEAPLKLAEDQEKALQETLDFIENGKGFYAVKGPAGSGKTTLEVSLLANISETTHLLAPTGKASRRMTEATGNPSATMHSAMYWPPDNKKGRLIFDNVRPEEDLKGTVLCDEASMISPSLFNDMHEFTKTKWVLIGDTFQLPPITSKKDNVEDGWSIFSEVEGSELTEVKRQALNSQILFAATQIRLTGKMPKNPEGDPKVGVFKIHDVGGGYKSIPSIVTRVMAQKSGASRDHVFLTWTNKTRRSINTACRDFLGLEGPPQEGEPLIIDKNSQSKALLNGDVVYVISCEPCRLLDDPSLNAQLLLINASMGGEIIRFLAEKDPEGDTLHPVAAAKAAQAAGLDVVTAKFGYCLTAHKAQGSEYKFGTIIMPKREFQYSLFQKKMPLPDGTDVTFAHRWLYTAITRFKKTVQVVFV